MKMSRKRLVSVLAAAAVLLAAGLIVVAQQTGRPGPGGGFRGGPGGGPRGGLVPFARELNLTDEQRAQVEKITAAFEESTKALHEQLRAQHESESDPFAGGTFDEAAVRKAAQARAALMVELDVARARAASQVYALLTDEQKARVAELRKQFAERGPGRGRGGPRGGERPDENR